MMISPLSYIKEHENDTFEQLMKERDRLVNEIRDLEHLVFDEERTSDEWFIKPSPYVKYQMSLEYLSSLCTFIQQKFNAEIVHRIDSELDNSDEEEPTSSITIQKIGITKLKVDAIVNAANDRLLEGGGVCGAIFREAGSAELTKACSVFGECKTGNAVITPGFKLSAKFVIHAVGPIWKGGEHNEPKLLYSAYKQSLILAKDNGCHSIAFPLISAGIFGYPKDKAWRKAIQACHDFIKKNPDYPITIIFAVLDDEIKAIGEKTLVEICDNTTFGSLTRFISELQDGPWGEWVGNQENDVSPDHPIQILGVSYTDVVNRFRKELYSFAEKHPEFDLNRYQDTLESYGLKWDFDTMKTANVDSKDAKCILALIMGAERAEHFCEGALLDFFKEGCILRWLERLEAIDNAS